MPRFGILKDRPDPRPHIFTADERANRNVDILREFAKEQGIKFYDITDRANFKANPDYKGVHAPSRGSQPPWEVCLAPIPHLQCWCFGQFATGIGNTDAGFIWALASC